MVTGLPNEAPGVPAPTGTPAQLQRYYVELALAQLHCALAALALNDPHRLRSHLGRATAAIDKARATH